MTSDSGRVSSENPYSLRGLAEQVRGAPDAAPDRPGAAVVAGYAALERQGDCSGTLPTRARAGRRRQTSWPTPGLDQCQMAPTAEHAGQPAAAGTTCAGAVQGATATLAIAGREACGREGKGLFERTVNRAYVNK